MNKLKYYSFLVLSIFLIGISIGFLENANQNRININQRTISENAYIKDIQYGYNFGVALVEIDGQDGLYTWGGNSYGELGKGTTGGYDATPTLVYTAPQGSTIEQISVGTNLVGMVVNDGNQDSLYTWGLNSYGELGLGDTVTRNTPTLVGTYDDIIDISFSRRFATAIMENPTNDTREVYGWGRNNGTYGVWGSGTNNGTPLTKVYESDNSEFLIKDIEAGRETTYFWGTDLSTNKDKVYSTGTNYNYNLGEPSTYPGRNYYSDGSGALNAPSGTKILSISADGAFYQTLYDPSTGNYILRSVGNNSYGQIGNGTMTSITEPYVVFSGPDELTSLNAGNGTVSVVKKSDTDYTYYTWGYNGGNMLGIDGQENTTYVKTPTAARTGSLSDEQVIDASFAESSSMILVESYSSTGATTRSIYAVGDNSSGQLGLSNTTSYTSYQLMVTAEATSHPTINNNEIIIDPNSIANNSFEFTIQISDPDAEFDPNLLAIYSNGDLLNSSYLEEVNPGIYKYKVDQLEVATTYNGFSIKPNENEDYSVNVSGSVTTNTPEAININDVTIDETATTKNSITFIVDLNLNDYTIDDINAANYTIEDLSDPSGSPENLTAPVVENNGVYSFTIDGLEPAHNYAISNIFLSYQQYDGDEIETNQFYNTPINVETTDLTAPEINNAMLDGDSINNNQAIVDLDIELNDYTLDDINMVNYTITDQFTDTSTIKTSSLEYSANKAGGYYFIISDLESITYYTVSDISLSYSDSNGDVQQSNVIDQGQENGIDFNTNVINGQINSVEFLGVESTEITFNVKYSDLGSFDPEDLMVSYKINGQEITTPVNPKYLKEVSPGVYQYKLTDLNPGSNYSDFKFFLPNNITNNNELVYDYTTSDYNSNSQILTDQGETTVDYNYGIKIDDRNKDGVYFSMKFNQLGVAPEYIQASYVVDGKEIMPSSQNPTVQYVGRNSDGSYQFQLINLTKKTEYSDLKIILPFEFNTDSQGNINPNYGSKSEIVYAHNQSITTKSLSVVAITFIAIGAALAILLFWSILYIIGKRNA